VSRQQRREWGGSIGNVLRLRRIGATLAAGIVPIGYRLAPVIGIRLEGPAGLMCEGEGRCELAVLES
jgi:hypothetical protein